MSSPAHSTTTQTAVQSVTGTAYTTVLSHASGNFVAGGKYLLLVTALTSGPNASDDIKMIVTHGGTAFADSEYVLEPASANRRYDYTWFKVWVAVGGEAIDFQIAGQLGTTVVTADQIVISAIRLDVDLVENTDWFYAESPTDIVLSLTPQDGASVAFTSVISSNWLVITTSQFDVVSTSASYSSVVTSTGTYNESLPHASRQGENGTNILLHTMSRVFGNLGAASQTYKEQSYNEFAVSGSRLHSAIFALDLTKFRNVAFDWDEEDEVLSPTDWDNTFGSLILTPGVPTDAMILCSGILKTNTTGQKVVHRLQSDATDTPASQTSDRWNEEDAAADTDEMAIWRSSLLSLTTATHLIEWAGDGIGTLAGGPAVRSRSICAFSLELSRDLPAVAVMPYQTNAVVVFQTTIPYESPAYQQVTWTPSATTVNAWWSLSAVSSIYSNDTLGVDYRYKVSDINGVRLSDESWRDIRAYTSQLSMSP